MVLCYNDYVTYTTIAKGGTFMKFIPYLAFEGNAEEAINFYSDAIGGEASNIMLYKDLPPSAGMPPTPDDYVDKILHASFIVKGAELYLSDMFPGSKVTKGNVVEVNIDFDTEEELRNAFDKLAIGAKISMPVDNVFWGSIFGSLTDKFGVGWSLNYSLPQE